MSEGRRKPTLMVMVGSTRPTRLGAPIARWFVDVATDHGGFELVVADLGELALPFLDEPENPRHGRYFHEHTKRWSEMVSAIDALVVVTPEYNGSLTAPVKNAIDFLYAEWHYKAVGYVSYGGRSAGTRAAQALRQVASFVKMVPVADAVALPFIETLFDSMGRFVPGEASARAAILMLDELVRLDAALQVLRAPA